MQANIVNCIENSNMQLVSNINLICNKNKKEKISILCLVCENESDKRIDNVLENINKGTKIVCRFCKENQRVERVLKRCELKFDLWGERLKCKLCKRQYDNDLLNNFKCYCKMKTRKQEKFWYDVFYDLFADKCNIYKEYSVDECSNKNYDIFCAFKDLNVFIEVDDNGHFTNSKTKDNDFLWTNFILNEYYDEEERVLFIRINDKIRDMNEIREIKELIKRTVEDDSYSRKLLVINKDDEFYHLTNSIDVEVSKLKEEE